MSVHERGGEKEGIKWEKKREEVNGEGKNGGRKGEKKLRGRGKKGKARESKGGT